MRTVDCDVALGELEDDALLRIGDVDRFQSSKDERVWGTVNLGSILRGCGGRHTITHNDRRFPAHCFPCYGRSEVVGEQNGFMI